MAGGRAALGFRIHLGWAAVVALGGTRNAPRVLERRRLELTDPDVPESFEPYHKGEELPLDAAERAIASGRAAVGRVARRNLRAFVRELARDGHDVVASGVLLGSGRLSSSLEATLRSHAQVHIAEGELYRGAILDASEACTLSVLGVRERELFERARAGLGLGDAALKKAIAELGTGLGPPWRIDQKHASLAAWLALRARR